ncbi:hypothetical protein EF_2140 [Enterococcus faecalis V583]|uniref:Uncharacterized protein n=1 Tax=Enterococcus faecalis (strain ATCC 700802 / V583) TaxID=226185 RepID=Q832S8_ENTFA|nr:hypothetical protein EF_2140 [Enterococcus faecalis V583]
MNKDIETQRFKQQKKWQKYYKFRGQFFLMKKYSKRMIFDRRIKMTTKEKIEFIKQVTPHSDSEVEKIIKGMSDTSINRWYEIEKYRIDQELEEAVLTIYC